MKGLPVDVLGYRTSYDNKNRIITFDHKHQNIIRYNKQKAVVFNTYQAYLKSARRTVAIDLGTSRHDDFYFGAKLVRGAYMDQERRRAKSLGLDDPINVNYDATTKMYDVVLNDILEVGP